MTEPTPFMPKIIGDGLELLPDEVLESCKGQYVRAVIIGLDKDGGIHLHTSHGSRECLWLLERAKLHLMLETE